MTGVKDNNATKETTSAATATRKSIKHTPTKDSSQETKSLPSQRIIASSGNLVIKPKEKEHSSSSAANSVRPSISISKVRNLDSSSSTANSSYSASKSRDASPSELLKDRYNSSSTSSGFASTYSKLYSRSANKLQVNNLNCRPMNASAAISYLNASDGSARRRRQAKEEDKNVKSAAESSSVNNRNTNSNDTAKDNPENVVAEKLNVNVEMVEVNVVNRATSPSLCSTTPIITNFARCRRVEIAKTIEKTILRPKHKPASVDKEIQSDRMDDTTKYCRFNTTNTNSPWPSCIESKYSSMNYNRINNGSNVSPPKYSSVSSKSEKNSKESSPEKNFEKNSTKSRDSSASKSSSVSRSGSVKSAHNKSEKSKSKSPPIASQKSSSASPPKQKPFNSKALPPPAPKSESPTKTIPSAPISTITNSSSNGKWANKDFRKSALNVGSTDRPRKYRTSSVETDSDDTKRNIDVDNGNQKQPGPAQRSERSPSISSETSYSSNTTASNVDDVSKNFVKLKFSQPAQSTAQTQSPTTDDTLHMNNSNNNNINNSESVTYTIKIPTNSDTKIHEQQPLQQQQQNQNQSESCAIIDNSQSSIVFRALGPITKIFKTKSQQINDAQNNSDNDSAFSTNESIKQDTLSESMLNQTTTISNETKLVSSHNYLADDSSWIDITINDKTTDKLNGKNINKIMKNQLERVDSGGQSSWWMAETDNDDTMAEDITLNQSEYDEVTETLADCNNQFKIMNLNQSNAHGNATADQSKPWWIIDDSASRSDNVQTTQLNDIPEKESEAASKHTFKIKRIESGERAWWLCEDNIATGEETLNDISESNNEDVDFWADINSSLEASKRSLELSNKSSKKYMNHNYECDMNANYIPLGDRASPDGLEDAMNNNDKATKDVEHSFKKLFISRHQNIDDVLGGMRHALSPMIMNQFAVDSDVFQEILPSEVRIHDGTPQMPHMQYMEAERYVTVWVLFSFSILIYNTNLHIFYLQRKFPHTKTVCGK